MPMGPWQLALTYAAFAAIATLANLLGQEAVLLVVPGAYALYLAILVGTGIGLVLKYVLDKRYIFRFFTANAAQEGRTFLRYVFTGLVTTAIFWGFELAFHLIFDTTQARHVGAVIGLTIGYVLKYRLDKRHVFTRGASAC